MIFIVCDGLVTVSEWSGGAAVTQNFSMDKFAVARARIGRRQARSATSPRTRTTNPLHQNEAAPCEAATAGAPYVKT